ncbi:Protein PLANT CADMIUM RESISTANCE 9 [Linum perenne]
MNVQHNGAVGGMWTTGLCGCCEDPGSSCCWSGLVFCLLADIGISCLYSYRYRYKLRQQYKLPESPCGDCLVHWCCTPCAVCQEHRELKNRGIDPSKGWEVVSAMTPPEIATGMPRA